MRVFQHLTQMVPSLIKEVRRKPLIIYINIYEIFYMNVVVIGDI